MIHNHAENFIVTAKEEFTLAAKVWASDASVLTELAARRVGAGRLIPHGALITRTEQVNDFSNGVICLRR